MQPTLFLWKFDFKKSSGIWVFFAPKVVHKCFKILVNIVEKQAAAVWKVPGCFCCLEAFSSILHKSTIFYPPQRLCACRQRRRKEIWRHTFSHLLPRDMRTLKLSTLITPSTRWLLFWVNRRGAAEQALWDESFTTWQFWLLGFSMRILTLQITWRCENADGMSLTQTKVTI